VRSLLRVPSVLHVLPHRGGGAETVLDLLNALEGWSQERVPLSRSRRPLAAGPSIAVNWPRIARAARQRDLVHAHGDVTAVLTTPILRREVSVWHTHGLHFLRRATGLRLRLAVAGIRAAVASTVTTICTSSAERDELAKLLAPELVERLVVVYNGVPLPKETRADERVSVRRELGVGDNEVLCLYVGQLEERKDPATLLEAVQRSARQVPLALVMAGDGPLLGVLREKADSRVRLLGQRDDIPRLLAAADIFVMPSGREGLSMAVLEAMSHSVATIVADGLGNPEAVAGTGLVFPVGDVDALAQMLTQLTSNPDARMRLGHAARERVEEQFSDERFIGRIGELYEAALAAPPR
jgi:glycosyltransferase involved in cell wall biosynthesis